MNTTTHNVDKDAAITEQAQLLDEQKAKLASYENDQHKLEILNKELIAAINNSNDKINELEASAVSLMGRNKALVTKMNQASSENVDLTKQNQTLSHDYDTLHNAHTKLNMSFEESKEAYEAELASEKKTNDELKRDLLAQKWEIGTLKAQLRKVTEDLDCTKKEMDMYLEADALFQNNNHNRIQGQGNPQEVANNLKMLFKESAYQNRPVTNPLVFIIGVGYDGDQHALPANGGLTRAQFLQLVQSDVQKYTKLFRNKYNYQHVYGFDSNVQQGWRWTRELVHSFSQTLGNVVNDTRNQIDGVIVVISAHGDYPNKFIASNLVRIDIDSIQHSMRVYRQDIPFIYIPDVCRGANGYPGMTTMTRNGMYHNRLNNQFWLRSTLEHYKARANDFYCNSVCDALEQNITMNENGAANLDLCEVAALTNQLVNQRFHGNQVCESINRFPGLITLVPNKP